MRKLFVLLALGLVALVASCETLNVGTGGPIKGPANVQITVPTGITHGGTGTFSASWQGGIGATTATFVFSGCVQDTNPAPITNATSPASVTATFVGSTTGPTNCTVTVTVVDSNGQSASNTATFTVPVIPNLPPTLTTSVTGNTVTVTVEDLDGDDVDITWTATGGSGAPATATVTGGAGTANFTFSPADILAGGNVVVDFTGTDTFGNTGTAQATVTFAAFDPTADTLYAIPVNTSVAVGAPARIVVVTGTPANPFYYMTGVRVCAPDTSGFEYAANSFNVGATGGATGDADGIWGQMGVTNFLLPPDNFITESASGDGRTCIDFNVTPLDGSQSTTAEGALFNFEATFSTAGSYDLTFQQVETVNRTYYQDTNQAPDYFWGDITNDHAGVAHTITVN